ncbi:hypothetical protein HDU76_010055 [Blyttiomyces sp. JEL0837]|nr:hypothetical protein HDU76_010055 [Blyttiomyces sp. JEL0837]
MALCALGALLSNRAGSVDGGNSHTVYYERARANAMVSAEIPSIEHLQGLMMLFWYTYKSFVYSPVVATALSRSPHLTPNHQVKPLCDDKLWESLQDPHLLESEYYNPKPNSESPSNSICDLIHILRKVYDPSVIVSGATAFVDISPQSMQEDAMRRSGIQLELESYLSSLPESVKIPLDVNMFSRGVAVRILESPVSAVFKDFRNWTALELKEGTLKWGDIFEGEHGIELLSYLIENRPSSERLGKAGNEVGKMKPSEWYFEMCNRVEGPPWTTILIHVLYHTCVIMLHQQKLFKFVQLLGAYHESLMNQRESSSTPSPTRSSPTKFSPLLQNAFRHPDIDSLKQSFHECRIAAEHIAVILSSIINATSPGLKVYPGSYTLCSYHSASVFVMLLATRGYHFDEWDSDIDDETAEKYSFWLKQNVVVFKSCAGMEEMSSFVVASLQNLIDTVRRGGDGERIVIAGSGDTLVGGPGGGGECCNGNCGCGGGGHAARGVDTGTAKNADSTTTTNLTEATSTTSLTSTGTTVTTATLTPTTITSKSLEEDPEIASLGDEFRTSMFLENIRTVRENTAALTDLFKRKPSSVYSDSETTQPPVINVDFNNQLATDFDQALSASGSVNPNTQYDINFDANFFDDILNTGGESFSGYRESDLAGDDY